MDGARSPFDGLEAFNEGMTLLFTLTSPKARELLRLEDRLEEIRHP